jgi:putative sigma-54 modulation protein
MKITVTFRHLDPTPALKTYAIDKTAHVEKLLMKPEQAHWMLCVDKKRQIAECDILANGKHFIAKEAAEDLYAAMDEVIAKLASQARKVKGKVKSHKPTHRKSEATVRHASAVRLSSLASRGARLADGAEVVKTETLQPTSMDTEAAIGALEVSGKDFLIFTNRSTGAVNICYRRDDGFFGVIEPGLNGKKKGSNEIPFRFDVYAKDEDGKARGARMIRQRRVTVRPMTVQESVDEMNKSRNHFWVFADRASQAVNVVYRTRKGEYGLIET